MSEEKGELDEKDKKEAFNTEVSSGLKFPVIGIGASAGGLEAFEQFFTNIPSDTGMAFVLVTHLDPTHKSILSDLIKRYTRMTVVQAEDKELIKPNWAYIIPPNQNMTIKEGKLHLTERLEFKGMRLPIDQFFRSLAEEKQEKSIGIVLSGTGTDATLGLREIKGVGGMVMVQDPVTAKYDGMPRSAIDNVIVDFILPPNEMPEYLIKYVKHLPSDIEQLGANIKIRDSLEEIFTLLHNKVGHDFSAYKLNTLFRRIERRMTVCHITQYSDYIQYLKDYPEEIDNLFRELLIGVTNFFRDKEAFKTFNEQVVSKLFENKNPRDTIRIWILGCSTGEEAYSIAMLVKERIDLLNKEIKVQIFATDIDARAIDKARQGIFPDNIIVDIPLDLITKYFSLENNFYQIKKKIRDMIVFAVQNAITDPPFSNVDLICCRNLLIYLTPEIQKKLLLLFHYSLNQNGYLFLGNSESINEFANYFNVINKKWKIFQKKEINLIDRDFTRPFPPLVDYTHKRKPLEKKEIPTKINYRNLIEQLLIEKYAPTSVIINEKFNVLYTHGHTYKFLELPSGETNLNLLNMARESYKLKLIAGLRKLTLTKKEIRFNNLKIDEDGNYISFNLILSPILNPKPMEDLILIQFEEIYPKKDEKEKSITEETEDVSQLRIKQLEMELSSTKQYLQTTIEELETSNEELKSTNEELQSTNEELQSTNEELQTSKEELQSINEELVTVNTELDAKIVEITKANNDMNNLLSTINVGTLFLDDNLNINRFTPPTSNIFNLIQTDIGRPISDISSNLEYKDIMKNSKKVLKTLIPFEVDVKNINNTWYTMRIVPYRTADNKIEGIVISFIDITKRKLIEEKLRLNSNIFTHLSEGIALIKADDGKIVYTNPVFEELFGYKPGEMIGKYSSIVTASTDKTSDEISEEIMGILLEIGEWHGELMNIRKNGTTFWCYVNISLFDDPEYGKVIVSIHSDITEKKEKDIEIYNLAKFPSEDPNPVLRVNNERVIYTNKVGETLFNINEVGLIPEVLEQPISKTLANNEIQELELMLNRRTYTLAITPVENMNYVNIYGMDITERKKAEEKLSHLISMVSHELRTPIAVLLMSIEYINQNKDNLTEESENELWDGISRNIRLLNKLVEDILVISRIDESKLQLEIKEFSPLDIINDILYLMEPLRTQKKVDFIVDVDKDIRLNADPNRIDQAFRVIIDNAIKYSKDNSKVEIRAIKNYRGKYNLDETPGVLFQFKDYGRGIPKEDQPNIFERFFRSSNVSDISGTGLGLAIAKDLIEAHKGQISMKSKLEEGTTFYLFIPQKIIEMITKKKN